MTIRRRARRPERGAVPPARGASDRRAPGYRVDPPPAAPPVAIDEIDHGTDSGSSRHHRWTRRPARLRSGWRHRPASPSAGSGEPRRYPWHLPPSDPSPDTLLDGARIRRDSRSNGCAKGDEFLRSEHIRYITRPARGRLSFSRPRSRSAAPTRPPRTSRCGNPTSATAGERTQPPTRTIRRSWDSEVRRNDGYRATHLRRLRARSAAVLDQVPYTRRCPCDGRAAAGYGSRRTRRPAVARCSGSTTRRLDVDESVAAAPRPEAVGDRVREVQVSTNTSELELAAPAAVGRDRIDAAPAARGAARSPAIDGFPGVRLRASADDRRVSAIGARHPSLRSKRAASGRRRPPTERAAHRATTPDVAPTKYPAERRTRRTGRGARLDRRPCRRKNRIDRSDPMPTEASAPGIGAWSREGGSGDHRADAPTSRDDHRRAGTPSARSPQGLVAVLLNLGVLTALLVYFGWVRSDRHGRRARVSMRSILRMSVEDYLLRSVRSVFVPVLCIGRRGLALGRIRSAGGGAARR